MKKLHAERLLQVVRVLEGLPKEKRFDLSIFHRCGTVACALGWVAADPWFKRRGYTLIKDAPPWRGHQYYLPVYRNLSGYASAVKFFSMRIRDVEHLFSPRQYDKGKSGKRDVIRRIKAFVKANT